MALDQPMRKDGVAVNCDLTDCAFYSTRVGAPKPLCRHPQIEHYRLAERCPLYRLDWEGSEAKDKEAELRKRFGIPGK